MKPEELIKAKRDYDARLRGLNASRYAAMEPFRDAYPDDLGFKFDPMTTRLPFDILMEKLGGLEDKVMVTEKYLDSGLLTDAELGILGIDPVQLRSAHAAVYPVKSPIPDGLVLMTFDDATLDHYTMAAPILEKYGGRGNFFVCEMAERLGGGPGFEDKSFFMTWEQIRELGERGHEIVNHSLTHPFGFMDFPEERQTAEFRGVEARCREYGIPLPGVFGYPGGGCDGALIELAHALGYKWARGDQKDAAPRRVGQSFYDPLLDCPLAMPSFNGAPAFDKTQLSRCVNLASGGRAVLLAYHGVDTSDFTKISFEEQVAFICACGGRCVTFTELEKYVDPQKSYDYWRL